MTTMNDSIHTTTKYNSYNKPYDSYNKRYESYNKRYDSYNKRYETYNKRYEKKNTATNDTKRKINNTKYSCECRHQESSQQTIRSSFFHDENNNDITITLQTAIKGLAFK